MILIPLAGSGTRGDQVENARCLEKAGAAEVLTGDVTPEAVAEAVSRLAEDGGKRRAMAEAAQAFASVDGARVLAGEIAASIGQGKN
jgi:UDP-N-acetylglucosamine--N-acetylmuramyl-(pentapeptide) pyrophosphoryl-undecaprenol N-acetylglucosamine transferase